MKRMECIGFPGSQKRRLIQVRPLIPKKDRCKYFCRYLRNANDAKICTTRKFLHSQYLHGVRSSQSLLMVAFGGRLWGQLVP